MLRQLPLLKQAYDGQDLATFLLDAEHRVVLWNRACEELTGVDAGAMLGRADAWSAFYRHRRPCLADLVLDRRCAEAATAYAVSAPARHSDSGWHAEDWISLPKAGRRYLCFDASAVHDAQGDVIGVIQTLQNITERKLLEESLAAERGSLQAVLDNTPVGIWFMRVDGKMRFVNKTFCNAVGIAEQQFMDAHHYSDVLDQSMAENCMRSDRETLAQEQPHLSYETLTFTDGKPHRLEITKVKLRDGHGEVLGVIGIALDITERERAQEHMELTAAVFGNTAEAIIVADANHNILSVNHAFTHITGYEAIEVLGKNPRILQSGRQDAEFYRAMWNSLEKSGQWHGEIWNRRKNGEIYPQWLTINAIRNIEGEVTHYAAIATDVTEHKQVQQRLEHLARHDTLTGLPNRSTLAELLKQTLKHAETGQQAAIMFIDLDRFKTINDTLGHTMGDGLLRAVAARLKHAVRGAGTVARLGGDEFIIILPRSVTTDAARVAHDIGAVMQHPVVVDNCQLHITSSIGIAMFPKDGRDGDTLMRCADNAMYHAKSEGRNTYRFFSSEMDSKVRRRYAVETDLRHALANGEFELYFQRQVDVRGTQVVGCEALLRWNHPKNGLMPPAEFIHIAEDTGLIVPIGEWLLRAACAQQVAWREAGHNLRMSVNLSARQFQEEDLLDTIDRALRHTGADASRLELEITESLLMDTSPATLEKLEQIAARGLTLAVDDFGTGYSSLSYLKNYPVSRLKIDRSFVTGIEMDASNRSIASAIVTLAHALGFGTIAEGVENQAQADVLDQLGCMELQGYHYGRPLPAARFAEDLHLA